jgi:hypothetical protein
MDVSQIPLRDALVVFAICAAAAIAGAVALLFMAAQQVRDLNIPPDADFFEVMQVIPVTIPIALDLLDGALDVFSAPISWIILEMMGLGSLKMITLVESLIPGTQLIPTLTISWIIGRYFVKDRQSPFRDAMRQVQGASQGRYPELDRSSGSRADYYRDRALGAGTRTGTVRGQVMVDGEAVISSRKRRSRRRTAGSDFGVEDSDTVDADFYEEDVEEPRRLPGGIDADYDGESFVDGEEL